MKIISFGWTCAALVSGRKTCTRRHWKDRYAESFDADELCQAWDKSPRFYGKKVAIIRLTVKPYKQPAWDAPDEDWEAEGFGYLTEIGAKIDGLTPAELWRDWTEDPEPLWVVRFELISVLRDGYLAARYLL